MCNLDLRSSKNVLFAKKKLCKCWRILIMKYLASDCGNTFFWKCLVCNLLCSPTKLDIWWKRNYVEVSLWFIGGLIIGNSIASLYIALAKVFYDFSDLSGIDVRFNCYLKTLILRFSSPISHQCKSDRSQKSSQLEMVLVRRLYF